MRNRLYIGEFAKLNRLSVKTVIHYHKVGLLPECERSSAGYRLYGLDDMKRMLLIRRLKTLGLGLKQIGCLIADSQANSLLQDYLASREQELTAQIAALETQLASIKMMMAQPTTAISDSLENPPSYQMMVDTLGSGVYDRNPDLARQEKELCEILDGYDWESEHQRFLADLTVYFRDNPDKYQAFVDLGLRLQKLDTVPEDSPLIGELARDYVEALMDLSVAGLLPESPIKDSPFSGLMDEMLQDALAPAQNMFMELCHKMLESARAADKPAHGI